MKTHDEATVTFTAWAYDRRFHALTGPLKIHPERCAGGETIYRLPAHATLIEPPEVEEGKAAVFLESTQHWIIVSDHRGETWIDLMGRRQTIERLGDPTHWDMRPG